jgi:hypothetical protein
MQPAALDPGFKTESSHGIWNKEQSGGHRAERTIMSVVTKEAEKEVTGPQPHHSRA